MFCLCPRKVIANIRVITVDATHSVGPWWLMTCQAAQQIAQSARFGVGQLKHGVVFLQDCHEMYWHVLGVPNPIPLRHGKQKKHPAGIVHLSEHKSVHTILLHSPHN
jgi:hypothetical protein